jgi:hypothetical protein
MGGNGERKSVAKSGNTKGGGSITVPLTSCLTESGNTKGGSITIPMTSCLTGLNQLCDN